MRASVLSRVRHLEVRDVPLPRMAPHEVLVRVGAVGLCGTDAHIFAGHANYNTDEYGQPIPFEVQPQTLGHEISGHVEEAGSEVHDFHRQSANEQCPVCDYGFNPATSGRK